MKSPPLKVWIWSILVVLALLAVLSYCIPYLKNRLLNNTIEVVFSQKKADSTAIKIIILGSSLVRQALSDPAEIEKLIWDKYRINTSIIKLTKSNATLEEFIENDTLEAKLIEYRPDYIVFQESVFSFEYVQPWEKYHFRKNLGLMNILKMARSQQSHLLEGLLNNNHLFRTKIDDLDILRLLPKIKSRKIRQDTSQHSLRKFSKLLSATDTKMIIMNTPMPEYIELFLDSMKDSHEYISYQKWVKYNFNCQYLDTEKSLPNAYYYDVKHMNKKGEMVYTDWFATEIGQLILSTKK